MNTEITINMEPWSEEDIEKLLKALNDAVKEPILIVRNPWYRWWKFWQPKYL